MSFELEKVNDRVGLPPRYRFIYKNESGRSYHLFFETLDEGYTIMFGLSNHLQAVEHGNEPDDFTPLELSEANYAGAMADLEALVKEFYRVCPDNNFLNWNYPKEKK